MTLQHRLWRTRHTSAPAPVDEYDASAARATPSPLVDGPVIKVVHVPQVQVVEKTIEIPQLQTIEEIVDIPEIQTVQSTESLEFAPVLEMALAEEPFAFLWLTVKGLLRSSPKQWKKGSPPCWIGH